MKRFLKSFAATIAFVGFSALVAIYPKITVPAVLITAVFAAFYLFVFEE